MKDFPAAMEAADCLVDYKLLWVCASGQLWVVSPKLIHVLGSCGRLPQTGL